MLKILISTLLIIFTNICLANPTTPTGGISFAKTAGITLIREDLIIGPQKIQISYVFSNTTKQDITVPMSLPLTSDSIQQDSEFSPAQIRAQGKTVTYNTGVRAIMDGRDITAVLQNAQLPTDPSLITDTSRSNLVTINAWQSKAKELKLVDKVGNPLWHEEKSHVWNQTFPVGKPLLIEVSYLPQTNALSVPVTAENDPAKLITSQIKQDFGINLADFRNGDSLLHWALQVFNNTANQGTQEINLQNIVFDFNDGLTWAMPIENFSLTINKPKSGAVALNHALPKHGVRENETDAYLRIFVDNFKTKNALNILFATMEPKQTTMDSEVQGSK